LFGSKLAKVFLLSRAFKNSEMLSSSVWKDPELAPPPVSASNPEPGWADDERLCFPLLPWSSSPTLLWPPNDNRPLRWEKLLLYRLVGGFGDVETGKSAAVLRGPPRMDAAIPVVRDKRFLA
jgi:hypothetical protein